jgi:hypothetical protein
MLNKKIIREPAPFTQATYDSLLNLGVSSNMGSLIPNPVRGEVITTHWALVRGSEAVNNIVRQ